MILKIFVTVVAGPSSCFGGRPTFLIDWYRRILPTNFPIVGLIFSPQIPRNIFFPAHNREDVKMLSLIPSKTNIFRGLPLAQYRR